MGKLTDEDLERLLRETFADKEKLADNSLPEATKRRRPVAPVLAAAASVLVVIGALLYGVSRGGGADAPVSTPGVAGAKQPASQDAEIWAAAITAISQRFAPKYGLQSLFVLQQTATDPRNQPAESAPRVFSPTEKEQIAGQVTAATRLEVSWHDPRTLRTANCVPTLADVTVGPIVDKGDHNEVWTDISYNCNYRYRLTYRIEKQDGVWKVTGIIGVPEGEMPVGCSLTKSANPQGGC